jgi:Na+-transporting NADH:ubiquinone oxidoreductase subunit C
MKSKLKNLIFILVLGSVSAGMLLGIRAHTLPIILHNQEMELKSTVLRAAGIEFVEETIKSQFDASIKEKQAGDQTYYLSPNESYIFEYKGRGLWGMIEGVLTVEPDLVTIESIQIISQEETPGLGGRIAEPAYLDSFKKKRVDPTLILAIRKKASKSDEIDAITGATISSQALVDTVNQSIKDFRESVKR